MIKLLAKNQSEGRYYFSEEDESVYIIKAPLKKSEKEYVDSLTVFLRKSIDADLVFVEQAFESLDELRAFAMRDCTLGVHKSKLTSQESLDDLLVYAPIEIVEEYFELIGDMIRNKEFIGLDLYFEQLSRNYELLDNDHLANKWGELWIAFDKARFPNITDFESANVAEVRIRDSRCVLALAV